MENDILVPWLLSGDYTIVSIVLIDWGHFVFIVVVDSCKAHHCDDINNESEHTRARSTFYNVFDCAEFL